MGTLSSELGLHVDRITAQPRVYADANIPAGLVDYMRARLRWDVLFVVEEADLRRASDRRHFALARQLRRTIVTFDRDYLDDRRFPPDESGGVLVLWAPDERACHRLLRRIHEAFFLTAAAAPASEADEGALLPLAGRKLHVQSDWKPDPDRP
ncbi:MAG TPA: DUF5615 family PIN-like protein [Vicinamibacterales bacterium]|nr:DUF5615 family PIN-like protein [Vicinamibacterales bacterium]